MTASPTVCDSSVLIALDQIGRVDLLPHLVTEVWVPPAVVQEIAPKIVLPGWIAERAPSQPIGPRILCASLGRGESEAISLALEADARRILLDDRAARRLAESLGLPVMGTLGILLAAKRRGLVPNVRPCLDALVQGGFYIASDLYERVLADAREADE